MQHTHCGDACAIVPCPVAATVKGSRAGRRDGLSLCTVGSDQQTPHDALSSVGGAGGPPFGQRPAVAGDPGPRCGTALWATRRTGLVTLRALFLAAASLNMGFALQRMPLGETVAIIYLAPFLVMLLVGHVLQERVSVAGWIGALVAFAGRASGHRA